MSLIKVDYGNIDVNLNPSLNTSIGGYPGPFSAQIDPKKRYVLTTITYNHEASLTEGYYYIENNIVTKLYANNTPQATVTISGNTLNVTKGGTYGNLTRLIQLD